MSSFGHLRKTHDSCEFHNELPRKPLSQPSWFVVTGGGKTCWLRIPKEKFCNSTNPGESIGPVEDFQIFRGKQWFWTQALDKSTELSIFLPNCFPVAPWHDQLPLVSSHRFRRQTAFFMKAVWQPRKRPKDLHVNVRSDAVLVNMFTVSGWGIPTHNYVLVSKHF